MKDYLLFESMSFLSMPRAKEISKTLVLKVVPDKETSELLRARGKSQSKWMNRIIRELYRDKRNNGWKSYGPSVEFGTDEQKWGALVTTDDNKQYKVRSRTFYAAFIGQATAPAQIHTSTPMRSTDKQATLDKVGTCWQNFLNGDVTETPRPTTERPRWPSCKNRKTARRWRRRYAGLSRRGGTHLPHFKPVAMFMHSDVDWSPDVSSVRLKFPGKVSRTIEIVKSDAPDFAKYIQPLVDNIQAKQRRSAEFHFDEQKKEWYVHVPVALPEAVPQDENGPVMGVDMGIRRDMAFAVVKDTTSMPTETGSISTNIERFVRNENRMKELRKETDIGRPWHIAWMRQHGASDEDIEKAIRHGKSARRAKARLRGKHTNMNKTMIREDTAHIVRHAIETESHCVATEDLSRVRFPKTYKRKGRKSLPTNEERAFNRRVTLWGRGWAKDALEHKCNEKGIRFRFVTSKGNSHTCPMCGEFDLENRDFKKKTFTCTKCGYASGDDDIVAAINIGRKGWQKFHPTPKSRSSPSTGPSKGGMGLTMSGLVTAPGATPVKPTDSRSTVVTSAEKSENPTNGPADPSEMLIIKASKSPQGPHVGADTSRGRKRSDPEGLDKRCERETRGGVVVKTRRTSRSDDSPGKSRRNRSTKGPKKRTLSQSTKGTI
jgi:predicted RNA-binding Zn-ribbon protein involved in translation (DUF1610 family)